MISSIKEWLNDPAVGNNSVLRLVAGTIFTHEQDYNEALKHTNAGGTMELLVRKTIYFSSYFDSDSNKKKDICCFKLHT